jgi:hypothetical protein
MKVRRDRKKQVDVKEIQVERVMSVNEFSVKQQERGSSPCCFVYPQTSTDAQQPIQPTVVTLNVTGTILPATAITKPLHPNSSSHTTNRCNTQCDAA